MYADDTRDMGKRRVDRGFSPAVPWVPVHIIYFRKVKTKMDKNTKQAIIEQYATLDLGGSEFCMA